MGVTRIVRRASEMRGEVKRVKSKGRVLWIDMDSYLKFWKKLDVVKDNAEIVKIMSPRYSPPKKERFTGFLKKIFSAFTRRKV